MKKQTAIKKAGNSVRKLAQLLDISTQAVHKWGTDVPDTSLTELKRLRPEWFAKEKKQ